MLDYALLLDACNDILPIIRLVKKGVLPLIQIGIPIILIIMGSLDLGKAVMSSDDKEIKAATGKFTKRAIAAVAVFFVITIVTILMGLFANTGDLGSGTDTASWKSCWNKA